MPVTGITPIVRITQAREEAAAVLTMYRRSSSTTLEEDTILRRRSDTIKSPLMRSKFSSILLR
jgi:hypothetical protein